MSLGGFGLEDLIILLAVGWFGGLIVASHLSARSKRGETTASRDHEMASDGSQNRGAVTCPASPGSATTHSTSRPVAGTSALNWQA
jgi:hypothetical protein